MRSLLLLPALALTLAAGVDAQTVGRHVFEVDSPASAFSFSGSVTFQGLSGPIVGNPATFNITGSQSMDLGLTAGGIANGRFVTGNGTVVTLPTLNALIPNPLPWLPPLARITVTGVTAVFRSVDVNSGMDVTFPVAAAAGGNFTTGIAADILTGTATVTGVVNQTLPLGGTTTVAQTVSGTLSIRSDGVRLNVPLNLNLQFSDPQQGVSGTLNLVGVVVADDRMFAGDATTISLTTGGTQVQRLSAGSAFGGRTYFVLGTNSGTSPGFTANGVNVPINLDGFTNIGLGSPNTLPYLNNFGVLDPRGMATAAFSLPRIPVTLNLSLNHAYGVFNGQTLLAGSNPVALRITP